MLRKLVSLVGFPLMALVAAGHGVLLAIRGLAMNFGWVLGLIIWPWTTARVRTGRIKPGNDNFWPFGVTSVATIILFFAACASASESRFRSFVFSREWFAAHPWTCAIFGIAALNALSGLYEAGRVYWLKVWEKKPENSADNTTVEVPKKPSGSVQNKPETFESMWGAIQDMKTISQEQSEQLYIDVIQLLQKGKIDGRDAVGLATAIHNGVSETIKLEKWKRRAR